MVSFQDVFMCSCLMLHSQSTSSSLICQEGVYPQKGTKTTPFGLRASSETRQRIERWNGFPPTYPFIHPIRGCHQFVPFPNSLSSPSISALPLFPSSALPPFLPSYLPISFLKRRSTRSCSSSVRFEPDGRQSPCSNRRSETLSSDSGQEIT